MSSTVVKLSKISPTDYKNLPKLCLNYGCASTKFGKCLLAFRQNTLCYLSFFDGEQPPLEDLKKTWQNADLTENPTLITENAQKLFEKPNTKMDLYLKGTDFEVSVWEALLNLKKGSTATYEEIARAVGRPKAVRAAAKAIGKNNVGYFVPCHRVIGKDGTIHKYRWGAQKKLRMLQDEGAL